MWSYKLKPLILETESWKTIKMGQSNKYCWRNSIFKQIPFNKFLAINFTEIVDWDFAYVFLAQTFLQMVYMTRFSLSEFFHLWCAHRDQNWDRKFMTSTQSCENYWSTWLQYINSVVCCLNQCVKVHSLLFKFPCWSSSLLVSDGHESSKRFQHHISSFAPNAPGTHSRHCWTSW